MLEFLSAISNRAGDLPIFGDGDNGQAVWIPETISERVHHLIGISRDRGTNSGNSNLRSMLLLWGQSPQEIPLWSVPRANEKLAFPEGGYYVLAANRGGENEMVVVFDAGQLGLPPLNAHGHADALSFWLSYGGEEFLVDPGTFTYDSSAKWRSYFRGTAAHNTIRIDQKDQSVAGGTFLWRETANCRIDYRDETAELLEVVASHDGYQRLSDPVLHTRKVQLFKDSPVLIITDSLHCRGTHHVELLFHFSEKCQVRQAGPSCIEAINDSKRISIRVDSRLKPELYRASEIPIFGWRSRTFGTKVPVFTWVAHTDITGCNDFRTEITAF